MEEMLSCILRRSWSWVSSKSKPGCGSKAESGNELCWRALPVAGAAIADDGGNEAMAGVRDKYRRSDAVLVRRSATAEKPRWRGQKSVWMASHAGMSIVMPAVIARNFWT